MVLTQTPSPLNIEDEPCLSDSGDAGDRRDARWDPHHLVVGIQKRTYDDR